jgi:hypothetical protein
MKTADIKFLDLCEEIDYWRERAEKAEADAEHWKEEYSKQLDSSLKSAQKGVANALMLALSVRDDENGNLVIDKKDRERLAESFKSEEDV